MDTFLEVIFGLLIIYVAVLTVMVVMKKEISQMMFTIGKYGIAFLAIATTLYYILK